MKGTRNDTRTIHHGYGRLRFWGFWIGLVVGCVVLVSAPAIAATLIRANQLSLSDTFAFTGAPAISATNAGVFTNTQANLYVTSALNGINIGTEFTSLQGGGAHQTDAISGGVAVPVGATSVGNNAVGAYAVTSANSSSRTVANTVALYGQCRMAASNSACWTGNGVVFGPGTGATGLNASGYEFDGNLTNDTFTYWKMFYATGLNQGGTLPASASAFEIATPYTLPLGFISDRHSATIGLQLNDTLNTNPSPSQPIQLLSHDSGGTPHTAQINSDANGNLILTTILSPTINGTPTGTGIATVTLKAGSGGGNYTGTNTTYTVAGAVLDSTNLCQVVTIPTGWKLSVTASGVMESLTAAVSISISLADLGTTCSTTGAAALAGSERSYLPPAIATFDEGFATQAVINGNGAAHAIALQALTSNAADAWAVANASASLVPSMILTLIPSN